MNLQTPPRYVEPLETRIAPALAGILVGAPGPSDTEYSEAPFKSTNGAAPNWDPADTQGANFVGGVNTFYLLLDAKNKNANLIQLYSASDGYKPFIELKKGTAVVFFHDANFDNEVSSNELTGVSLGPDAIIGIGGSVNGDIVTNLDPVTGQISPTTLIGPKQSIGGISVGGVNAIVSGGDIKGVTGTQVGFIYAGSAADGYAYDFNGTDGGGGAVLAPFVLAPGQAGGSIKNVTVTTLGELEAGGGGAGGKGGSVSNVTVSADKDGFLVAAGAGGNGTAAKPAGGEGGKVSTLFAPGLSDDSPDSNGVDLAINPAIQVLGGAGGLGLAGTGKGGKGGGVEKVYVGFSLVGGKPVQSDSFIEDSVLVAGGNGGTGSSGGDGGFVKTVLVNTLTEDKGLIPGTFGNNSIEVRGGSGGDSDALAGGKGGKGGSVSDLQLRTLDGGATLANVLVSAGNGGAPGAGANNGGDGGSVTKASLSTYHGGVQAGNGGNGTKTGGKGGTVSDITLLDESGSLIPTTPRTLDLNAGKGGDATAGAGGKGGDVSKVTALSVELQQFRINQLAGAGSGGTGGGAGGKGGDGGGVKDVRVEDFDLPALGLGVFGVTAGDGGNGGATGGKGGVADKLLISGGDFNYVMEAGDGGIATVAGKGGQGGALTNSAVASVDGNGILIPAGIIRSGTGGAGAGASGAGGAGGDIKTLNSVAVGGLTIAGGVGGNAGGATGAEGKGGSLSAVAAIALQGNASVTAGNAGTGGGSKGANGGKIEKATVVADLAVTILGGDGGSGGAGGDIKNIAFAGVDFTRRPNGVVLVEAGDGSFGAASAGKGGSGTVIDGVAGSGGFATTVRAGNGASTVGGTKTSDGGSLKTVTINGGGGAGSVLTVLAGNGGGDPLAAKGAKGGDLTDLVVGEMVAGSVFRDLAAGDGGDANPLTGTGGKGGKVDKISVAGDIGVRSGANFGFGSMGGIFAGSGGSGLNAGTAGSVTNVNANAIASIVAGRILPGAGLQAENLVSLVDNVYLNDIRYATVQGGAGAPVNDGSADTNYYRYSAADVPSVDPLVNEVGYANANLVGASVNPFAPDGNKFTSNLGKTGAFAFGDIPIDGMVAALVYPTGSKNKTNFVPEALITTDGAGNAVLIDQNNLL